MTAVPARIRPRDVGKIDDAWVARLVNPLATISP
jgi:hypothetical protein